MSLVIPVGCGPTSLSGDVIGPFAQTEVVGLLNQPLAPLSDGYLAWDGSNLAWKPFPTGLPPGGIAGGDLSGNYPNPEVIGLLNHALPSLQDGYLYWSGTAWQLDNLVIPTTLPPTGSAGGVLSGTYPNPGFASSPTLAGTVTLSALGAGFVQASSGGALSSASLTSGQLPTIALTGQVTGSASGGSIATALTSANLPTIALTGDVSGSASGGSIATTVTAISGSSPINITPAELQWLSTVSLPILQQATSATNSATGQILTIQAQSMSGTSSHGGNLYLASGTGINSDGYVAILCGNQTRMEVQDQLITVSADLSFNNFNAKLIKTLTYDQMLANGNSGASFSLDWSKASKQSIVLTGATNCTLSFGTAPIGVGNFLLKVIQNGSGSQTISWPSSSTLKWAGGSAPTLSTAANAVDIVSLFYDGTSYFATSSLGFA